MKQLWYKMFYVIRLYSLVLGHRCTGT